MEPSYLDPMINHKDIDTINDISRKNKMNFTSREYKIGQDGKLIFVGRKVRCMSKRYADNRQKVKK